MSAHPLAEIMAETAPILLIGDSDSDRFPRASHANYRKAGKAFEFYDLGKRDLTQHVDGKPVRRSLSELPEQWGGDLAILWLHPASVPAGLEVAAGAGCKRVWFSFDTGSPGGIALAERLGMQVVEVGRCPVFYMSSRHGPCAIHGGVVQLTGLLDGAPRVAFQKGQRELL